MLYQLQNFETEVFIRDYWQKKPCLIRQAFKDFEAPVTPEELAGLACEKEVHSRLVMEAGGDSPWQLRYGPFEEKDFLNLPESHYSLLVSECEKWIPEFAELIDQFRFIPDWRIDDLMVSYAPAGGSVGPHNDEYDVFLLQAQGHRLWQYSDTRVEDTTLIPNLDLAIIQDFEFDHEALLAPGDMLYLPPGVSHFGVAQDKCLTCSIGFRAPTAIEVLESVSLEIDRSGHGSKRYSDPNLDPNRHAGEITENELKDFKSLVTTLLDQPDELWEQAIGKLLSDSVVSDQSNVETPISFATIQKLDWVRNSDSKMLYRYAKDSIRFYCNGEMYELGASTTNLETIQTLCLERYIPPALLESCVKSVELQQLLVDLANTGAILPEID